MIQITRHKKAFPKEAMYKGVGASAKGSIVPPGFIETVGCAVLMNNAGVVTEKYGVPILLEDGLFMHMRMVGDEALEQWRVTVWLAAGPICDPTADPTLGAGVRQWITDRDYKTINLKKRNDGSFGAFKFDVDMPVTGNYILLVDGVTDSLQHTEYYENPGMLHGPAFSQVEIVTNTIGILRDCKIYIRPTENDNVTVSWTGAYNPEAHEETLWLMDIAGNLISEMRIYEDEKEGSRTFPVVKNGTYQLHIPGYSHRNYRVTFNDTCIWLMEPAKLQFMGSLPGDSRFYFKVYPGEAAKFCMKDYTRGAVEGTYGAILTRMQDDMVINCTLNTQEWYYQYDTFDIPVETEEQWWRLDLKGLGRSAFWLDGIPNLFTDRLSWYDRIVYDDNDVATTMPEMIPANSVGHMPTLGHYMPYVYIPVEIQPLLLSLKAECACIYSIVDVLAERPDWEDQFRGWMSTAMKLKRDYTIQSRNGRDAYLDFNQHEDVRLATDNWIKSMARINDGREHYIAPIDEPNYNFPTFESYRSAFYNWAMFIRTHPQYAASGARIMAAASSRFDHGPNSDDSYNHKGYFWARDLIALYPHLVDAVVWHEWTVRGLLNLRQYGKSVELAYTLSNNGQRKLAIEQTNTAGGSSVSLYDQNTHFACLWWAAVFIACSRTGKLDDLMWFPIADEKSHPKGLLYESDDPQPVYTLKPIGYFHIWLAQHLHGCTDSKVYPCEQTRIEVDLLCFSNVKAGVTRKFFFGVNKGPRTYEVFITNYTWTGPVKLELYKPDTTKEIITPTINTTDKYLVFNLPAEHMFMLSQGVV